MTCTVSEWVGGWECSRRSRVMLSFGSLGVVDTGFMGGNIMAIFHQKVTGFPDQQIRRGVVASIPRFHIESTAAIRVRLPAPEYFFAYFAFFASNPPFHFVYVYLDTAVLEILYQ